MATVKSIPSFCSLRDDYWHRIDACNLTNHYPPDAKEFRHWLEIRKINWSSGKIHSTEVFVLDEEEMDKLVDFWNNLQKHRNINKE